MKELMSEVKTDIKEITSDWITVGNSYNVEDYLAFYHKDIILNDPSVGRKFIGLSGIKEYFESYFVGYQTQTTIVTLNIIDAEHAHLEVSFTGNFPEGEIGGIFDLTFKAGKISSVEADLSS
jgi:ketosteroid isomerase-like protein